MKRITNRSYLNKYNNFPIKKPKVIEILKEIEVVELVIEPVEQTQDVEVEMTQIYDGVAEEKIETIENIEPPTKIPSLKLIVEKILLEKRLEKINGWIFK
jgi:hypothetical protein